VKVLLGTSVVFGVPLDRDTHATASSGIWAVRML
jgi:hypothetical protein